MNVVVLAGRLTRDPRIINVDRGSNSFKVVNFTIAIDRRTKPGAEKKADFINCVAYGGTAGFLEKYFRKGMKIDLRGRLQSGSYTNKEGQKVYTTDVVVEECRFGESRSASQQRNSGGYSNPGSYQPQNRYQVPQAAPPSIQTNSPYTNPDAANYGRFASAHGVGHPGSVDTANVESGFINIPEGIDEDLPFN